MAMDEAVMLDVLKAITRVEMKVDMMMAEDASEDSEEEDDAEESSSSIEDILGTSYC